MFVFIGDGLPSAPKVALDDSTSATMGCRPISDGGDSKRARLQRRPSPWPPSSPLSTALRLPWDFVPSLMVWTTPSTHAPSAAALLWPNQSQAFILAAGVAHSNSGTFVPPPDSEYSSPTGKQPPHGGAARDQTIARSPPLPPTANIFRHSDTKISKGGT